MFVLFFVGDRLDRFDREDRLLDYYGYAVVGQAAVEGVVVAHGVVLALGDDFDAVLGDAAAHELFLNLDGTLAGEAGVVGLGAHVVAVAGEQHFEAGLLVEVGGEAFDFGQVGVLDGGVVGEELDVGEGLGAFGGAGQEVYFLGAEVDDETHAYQFLGGLGFGEVFSIFPVAPVDFGHLVGDFVLHLFLDEDVAEVVERDDGLHLGIGNEFIAQVLVGDGGVDGEDGADVHGYASGAGQVVHHGVEFFPVAILVALPFQGTEFVVVVVYEIERLGIEGGEFPHRVVGRLAHFVLAAHVDDGFGFLAFLAGIGQSDLLIKAADGGTPAGVGLVAQPLAAVLTVLDNIGGGSLFAVLRLHVGGRDKHQHGQQDDGNMFLHEGFIFRYNVELEYLLLRIDKRTVFAYQHARLVLVDHHEIV